MMEVEVEELCTSTVTRIPTTSPATGLERMALSLKMSPATLPARERERQGASTVGATSCPGTPANLPPASWKAELSTSREHTKRYRNPNIRGTLRRETQMDWTLAQHPSSAQDKRECYTPAAAWPQLPGLPQPYAILLCPWWDRTHVPSRATTSQVPSSSCHPGTPCADCPCCPLPLLMEPQGVEGLSCWQAAHCAGGPAGVPARGLAPRDSGEELLPVPGTKLGVSWHPSVLGP